MLRAIDSFFHQLDEPNKSCLFALRAYILQYHPQITETWKYRMPCYCYKGKMFCYLWIDKKTKWPYILMVEGRNIEHSLLVMGDRSRMKIFLIDPDKDLPLKTINSIFKIALALYD